MADSSDNIQIVIQDQVSNTIAPKLKNIETNALNAMDGLSRMQQALRVVDPSGLRALTEATRSSQSASAGATRAVTMYAQAAGAASTRFDTLTTAIDRNSAAIGRQVGILREYANAASSASAASSRLTSASEATARAQRAVGGAAQHGVSQMQAASAAIRVFEGGMTGSVRAAERFLSTIPGVGKALQVAFPVVGALALAGVLAQIVGRVYEVVQSFMALRGSVIALETTNILQGNPEVRGQHSVGSQVTSVLLNRGLQSNTYSFDSAETEKRKQSNYNDQLKVQYEINEAGLKGSALEKQKAVDAKAYTEELNKERNLLVSMRDAQAKQLNSTTNVAGIGQYATVVDKDERKARQADLNAAVAGVEDIEKEIYEIKGRGIIDQKKQAADGAREGLAAAKKADAQRVEDLREGLKVYEETNGSSLEAQKAYWDQYLRTETAGSKAAAAVRKAEEIIGAAATTELLKSKAEYVKQVQASLSDIAKESDLSRQSETTNAIKEGTRETLGYLSALRDVAIAERAVNGERALALTQYQAERGLITPAAAAMQEYQTKLGVLTDQYNRISEKIRELQSNPNLGMTGGKDIANLQAQQQQVGTQIGTLRLNQPNNSMTAGNIFGNSQGGLAAEITQAYKPVQELQTAFKGLNDTMIDGTANAMAKAIVNAKSLGDAFKQVGKEIEQQLIGALIKLGLQWVEMQILQATLGTAAAATGAAQATGLAAAWAPAAFAASVATLGGADAIGGAAYATGLTGAEAMSAVHLAGGSNGPLSGRGTTLSDSIPAMLSVGETVVSAADTARNLPTLQAIQSGRSVNQAPNIQVIHDGSTSIQALPGPTHGDVVFMASQIAQQTVAQNTDAATSAALNNPNSATSRAMRQNYASDRIR